MPRTSLTLASLVGLAIVGTHACAPEIGELEETPAPDSVVVAQFDPTNPIPQLQVIPSPTALAQNDDGSINQDAVRPAPCELPTAAQCLQFVAGGWPVTLFPTLNFSAPLVMDTLQEGIRLYRVTPSGLQRVPVQVVQTPRSDPPDACQSGGNGSQPEQTFSATDVTEAWGPTPTDLTLIPTSGALDPETQYIVVATRELEGSSGGPETNLREVEPSALFFLLNSDDPPVTEDGNIIDPLLRSNVQSSILQTLFGGRGVDALSSEEQAQFTAAVTSSGQSLFALYRLVDGSITALLDAGELADRADAVIVNSWTTGGGNETPTEVVFAPADSTFPTDVRFPLPSDPLLTTTTADGLRVNFPTDGLSPTLEGVVGGLNTLSGFGVTTPILIQTSRQLDASSLEGNIVMVELDDGGMPTETRPELEVSTTASTAESPPQLVVRPVRPLKASTRYAVGITTGALDIEGRPIVSSTQFELVKRTNPLIEDGVVDPEVVPQLQCAGTSTAGEFPSDTVVQGLATQLETGLARPRWQAAFEALEGLSPSIPRSELAMAFTYTTQSVTDTLDSVKAVLLPNRYPNLLPMQARVVDTGAALTGTATLAAAVDFVDNFCIAACETGALEPGIPISECRQPARRAAIASSALCQQLQGAFFSGVGGVQILSLRTYRAVTGNPFVSGAFSPETIQTPSVEYIPLWVITPTGPPPTQGWPTVIFQHGLGSSKEVGLLAANTLAANGWATVGFDLPFHGERATDIVDNATGVPCTDIDPANVTCDSQMGTCANGCDGLQDPSGTGFLTTNIFAIRDNFRQATLDHLALLDALETEGSSPPLGALDPNRIGYIGQSLGGLAGANLAAVAEPMDLEAAALNAAGGNLFFILENTVPDVARGIYAGLAQAGVCELVDPAFPEDGCRDTPLFQAFRLLAQWVTEPGDPNGTASAVTDPMRTTTLGPDRILMQVSQPDPVIDNRASQQLAVSYGFDLAQQDGPFQIYDFSGLPNSEVDGGCHSFFLAPSCGQCVQDALCNTFGAQQQAAAFVDSGGSMVIDRRPMTLFSGTPSEIDCTNPCGD